MLSLHPKKRKKTQVIPVRASSSNSDDRRRSYWCLDLIDGGRRRRILRLVKTLIRRRRHKLGSNTNKQALNSHSSALEFILSMADSDQILVEDELFVKRITLNRPRQLNALSDIMITRLLELFLAYEEDPNAKLIILKGAGRAFCAGGDVAAVIRAINKGDWRLGANFFWKEFILNYVMATYSKTQVSILNGIVMGGGAGASIHGRFRVATENTVFAMPETALGLFPDVGASYYLSRLPGFFGEYVGLTGARLDGAEMLACGLATHFVHRTKYSEVLGQRALELANSVFPWKKKLLQLEAALSETKFNDSVNVAGVIDKYADHPEVKETSAYRRLDIIQRCFSHRTVEEIFSAVEKEAAKRHEDWIAGALASLKKASPTSLKISLKSIREGRLQGVGQCLVREYRMVCHVLQGEVSRDFSEGCRAILLDKDRNPKWEPSSLDQVSDSMVDRYFDRVDEEDWEDLKLPTRSSNLPAFAIAKL
ncbi:3-hydroxyisobutyryl-CoA hydrolase 1-like protein [Drosera capensis]